MSQFHLENFSNQIMIKIQKSNVLQTIDGIYLQYLDKIQGGRDIFDLHSDIVITICKMI